MTRREILSSVMLACVAIGTAGTVRYGYLKLADFYSVLPYLIIATAFAIFGWGFLPRIEKWAQPKAKLEGPSHDEEEVNIKQAISNEFSSIVHSLEPPREVVIPFHTNHINYYLWNTKTEGTKIAVIGANDFGLLQSFYKGIDRWNEQASRRFQEIHNETVNLVKLAANVYEHITWIRSTNPDLEEVVARLRKRFGSNTKGSGIQEVISSID